MLSLNLALVILAISPYLVTASPPVVIDDNLIRLPLTQRFNLNGAGSARRLLQRDRERARALISRALSSELEEGADPPQPVSVSAIDAQVMYTVDIVTGSSPDPFTVIVDTGSALTWVGARGGYNATNPPKTQLGTVRGFYGSGGSSGRLVGKQVLDSVAIGGLKITNQSLGAAGRFTDISADVDGILGVGPTELTRGTIDNDFGIFNTVVDNAFDQKLIPEKKLGISFVPTTGTNQNNGELTFGGIDSTKYTGKLTTVPITSSSPANRFVGIDQTVSYDGQTILSSSGHIDTGTLFVLLNDAAFKLYQTATQAVEDPITGLYKVTALQYDAMKSLFFNIGGTNFEFTKNAQIFPRPMNSFLGGKKDDIFLIVSSLGTGGTGVDFINGMAWLQRFYAVYDSGNSQVSIATTSHTLDETN